jgi:GT2 family glycosyltransferase
MKNILIATPCLYGKVDAYYAHSLYESIKLGLKNNLDINAVFLAEESILTIARNELINLAYKNNYDSMVFIDDDELWNPKTLIKILLSEKDVVGLPVVNKGDINIQFNVSLNRNNIQKDETDGFIKVNTIGTGFLKLSKKIIVDLCESNNEILFRGKKLKNVFEFNYINGFFIGEDIMLCKKIKELGYSIWVDPSHTVSHMGVKMYKGDFEQSLS